jgi:hypothetical protein
MAKFKPVRPKDKKMPAPRGGIGCVILLIAGFILAMFVIYFVMKNANG